MTTTELLDKQSEIIRLQTEIIDELTRTLLQHIEMDDLPCMREMYDAAEMIEELG